jgi:hypothetical protein
VTPIASRRTFLGGAAALATLVLTGCGDDDEPGGQSASATPSTDGGSDRSSTTAGPDAFPPSDDEALREIFDPRFEPLGQRVTRAGLYDLDGGYVRDERGTHLALYVEPIDPGGAGWDDDRYIATVAPGVAAAAPFIFERWSGVQTMDVCQEPPQRDAPEDEPPIETQVVLGRADALLVEWADVQLADLMAARQLSPETVRIAGKDAIVEHPAWKAAEEAAT